MPRQTTFAKQGEVEPNWRLVDAEGQTLGRMATTIATHLMGKHRPEWTPHVLTGDFVIVTNAEKLKLPVTEKEYESGAIELAKEVLKVLGDNKVIVLKNHGFVSLGRIMKEAGELAFATLKRSKAAKLATPHINCRHIIV